MLQRFPSRHVWIDYDEEADVLYYSFKKPQNASDSQFTDDDIIRRRGEKIVGVTIRHVSRFMK